MVLVAPSLLAADIGNLQNQVGLVEKAGADWLHFDIMDGHFVPNLSFGPDFVRQIRKYSRLFFDVHLMVEQPQNFISMFENCGADMITIHYEACDDIRAIAGFIKQKGMAFGLSVKPQTPAEVLKPYMDVLDNVLIMTVEPGFGGQKFMENQIEKIHQIKNMRENRNFYIEVDGGINIENAKKCVKFGADVLVAGNAIFKSQNPEEVIKILKQSGEKQ